MVKVLPFILLLIFIRPGTVKSQVSKDSASNFWKIVTKNKLDSLNKVNTATAYWENIIDRKFDSVYYTGKLPKYKTSVKMLKGVRDTTSNLQERWRLDGYISKIDKVDSLSRKDGQLENRLGEFNTKILLTTADERAQIVGETFMFNADQELNSYKNMMVANHPGTMAYSVGDYISSNTFTVYLTLDKRYLTAPSVDIFVTEDIGTATAQQIAQHIDIIPGHIDHYQDFEKESEELRDYFLQNLGIKGYTFEFALPAFSGVSHICPIPNLQKNLQWSVFVFQDKYLYAYYPLSGMAVNSTFFISY